MTTDNSQITLKLRTGQEIILPPRKDLLGGLKFTRRFSHNEVHPYDEVDWARRDVRIMDWKTGKTIYERLGLEAPAHWDDNAVKITADKYLFGSEPGSLEYEDSFRNIYDRISNTYTVWGWEEGYFATLEDAEIFNEEIKAMLVQQIWAPNSPVWFNIGHWEQWRWGRPDLRENYTGHGNKAYHAKGSKNNLKTYTVQSTAVLRLLPDGSGGQHGGHSGPPDHGRPHLRVRFRRGHQPFHPSLLQGTHQRQGPFLRPHLL